MKRIWRDSKQILLRTYAQGKIIDILSLHSNQCESGKRKKRNPKLIAVLCLELIDFLPIKIAEAE